MAVRKFVETFAKAAPGFGEVQEKVGSMLRGQGKAITDIQASPLSSARLLETVSLSTSPTNVRHNLGREWNGAIVVKGLPAGVTASFASSPNNSVWVSVTLSSGTATCNMLVF